MTGQTQTGHALYPWIGGNKRFICVVRLILRLYHSQF